MRKELSRSRLPSRASAAFILCIGAAFFAACVGQTGKDAGVERIATTQGCLPEGGDREWTIASAGGERRFLVHAPSPTGTLRPLVFNFHGASGNAEWARDNTRYDSVGDTRGMIVVHPDGYRKNWNAGTCCGGAVADKIDDVQFVRDMLDQVLIPKYCVDTKRVYATGLSNGGFFAHRLACDLSDRIAAIVSVAGINSVPQCNPTRAVSVLQIHGTDDEVIRYERALPSATAWASRNGCTRGPEETFRKRHAHCDSWSGCNGGTTVTLCTIDDLGHRWPGSTGVEGVGAMSADLSAGSFGADFMLRYSLP